MRGMCLQSVEGSLELGLELLGSMLYRPVQIIDDGEQRGIEMLLRELEMHEPESIVDGPSHVKVEEHWAVQRTRQDFLHI